MNWFANSYAPLQEFNRCHSPEDGKFCSDRGTSAKILQGVDSAANRDRLIAKQDRFLKSVGGDKTPREIRRERAVAEADLRALPLIHGTTLPGALAAIEDGLFSNRNLAGRRQALKADLAELDAEIRKRQSSIRKEDWAEFDALVQEARELRKVVEGTTADEDRALDLDTFVFMTHGDLHQDYGPLGVVIDNQVLQDEGWATPHDIITVTGSGAMFGVGDYRYDSEGVKQYQQDIVQGDDYFKAAATFGYKGLPYRSRDQLWEIKVPHVNKSAVRGFIIKDDLDLAIRLRDALAAKGIRNKVLYISSDARKSRRWQHRQLKHIQRTGEWNQEWAKQWEEQSGSGSVFVL